MTDPALLFVGHEASRTGAPVMLLHLLRWLAGNTDLSFALVLLDGGPLEDDYRAVTDVTVLERGEGTRAHRRRLRRLGDIPVAYLNSVSSIEVLPLLPRPPRLTVTHVHELDGALRRSEPPVDLDLLIGRTDRFVAASELVRQNLIDGHGIPGRLVHTHHEFIDPRALDHEAEHGRSSAEVRNVIGIPLDAPVIGAAGVTQWRKGPDLFVVLARLLGEAWPEAHLVWVGATEGSPEHERMVADITRAGLGDRVHVVPAQAQPVEIFRLFTVFVLTSREDPFPLVCLENAALGTPVVCFDNTGMAEFVGLDAAELVVPYLDLEAMVDRVVGLLADEAGRRRAGLRAARRVRADHDVAVAAPRLLADLEAWRDGR